MEKSINVETHARRRGTAAWPFRFGFWVLVLDDASVFMRTAFPFRSLVSGSVLSGSGHP